MKFRENSVRSWVLISSGVINEITASVTGMLITMYGSKRISEVCEEATSILGTNLTSHCYLGSGFLLCIVGFYESDLETVVLSYLIASSSASVRLSKYCGFGVFRVKSRCFSDGFTGIKFVFKSWNMYLSVFDRIDMWLVLFDKVGVTLLYSDEPLFYTFGLTSIVL